jgi:hypothetical protein
MFTERYITMMRAITNMDVNINLLFLANQFGRKISKLSFSESEYFLAIIVSGQNILKIIRVRPSPITKAIPIQVYILTLFEIPEYKT